MTLCSVLWHTPGQVVRSCEHGVFADVFICGYVLTVRVTVRQCRVEVRVVTHARPLRLGASL